MSQEPVPTFLGGVDQLEDGRWVTVFDVHESCSDPNTCSCTAVMSYRSTASYASQEEAIGALMDFVQGWKPPGCGDEEWQLLRKGES